jgi:hypothetical protein
MLGFLMTCGHQMRKHLRGRDQAVNVVPAILPLHPTVGLKGVEIRLVEWLFFLPWAAVS